MWLGGVQVLLSCKLLLSSVCFFFLPLCVFLAEFCLGGAAESRPPAHGPQRLSLRDFSGRGYCWALCDVHQMLRAGGFRTGGYPRYHLLQVATGHGQTARFMASKGAAGKDSNTNKSNNKNKRQEPGSEPDPVVRRVESKLQTTFKTQIGWINSARGRVKEISERINGDETLRKRFSAGLIILYVSTAFLAYRYLQDTKYKATGEQNPYKRPEMEDPIKSGQIPAADTTAVYEKMAREYDSKIWKEEFFSYIWYMRRRMMKQVQGDVLEVSCGTGRNVKYLNLPEIKSITFLDSSKSMLEVAKEKFTKRFPKYSNVQFVKGRAEDLEELTAKSGQKFDTIFESFGLCSHEDPVQALKSFKKLLKPNGKIILVEHGRSTSSELNKSLDERAERRMQEWGCRWNLDIKDIVAQSGLTVEEETRYHFGTTYFYVCK